MLRNPQLIRKGMNLRKKHLDLFYRMGEQNIFDYVERTMGYTYVAKKEYENVITTYDPKLLPKKLLSLYLDNPKEKIPTKIIDGLKDIELFNAFKSGYLKHQTNGYHFTRNYIAEAEVLK